MGLESSGFSQERTSIVCSIPPQDSVLVESMLPRPVRNACAIGQRVRQSLHRHVAVVAPLVFTGVCGAPNHVVDSVAGAVCFAQPLPLVDRVGDLGWQDVGVVVGGLVEYRLEVEVVGPLRCRVGLDAERGRPGQVFVKQFEQR